LVEELQACNVRIWSALRVLIKSKAKKKKSRLNCMRMAMCQTVNN
jgi:hypothetical protein